MKKAPLSGLRAWLIQRLTAVYLLVSLPLFIASFVFDPPGSYDAWRERASSAFFVAAGGVFIVALLVHAWVGLRDVALDYVKPLPLRIGVLALLGFGLVGMGAWALHALFGA
ncbi:succinate dehydrogenase, hydrophobic membrane anchor protein [Parapusillimonas granuli]|uniref:Succinate dehydrogenase hydrophobic membrane anchor subunit n=1 Tax=Parapusillimonas granuli TaxID=380911 RepID=A0A853G056_9BURK|nr:succinate dehydrogenase, hydrophobic membrane anchor protein [Parapusillimonas granuli]MBB5214950.1 succinate dehydrogenase / fumarate reductase membrane anchor subunit [Parapusillimonas granuli]MEB2401191.1 succinate dehydrogenase, hydrophobic membrane anchor protein [Alcaligenaceae bacterium]NYT49272.1 succinate dehydrogenase, hydrophobic membrane anchor protein [Parapusillimonas granuli]